MKKHLLPVFAMISALQFVACNSSDTKTGENGKAEESESSASAMENGHKYQIKSAIITSKITNTMMAGDISNILYFDDYGKDEMTKTVTKISMMGQNIESTSYSMTKDGWSYSWEEGKPTGSKFQMKEVMDPSKMDYSKLSEEMKEQFGIKQIGTETVMGKKCDKFTMNKDGMGTGTYWIWNNIPMKSETTMGGIGVNINVTDIDENPHFSKDQFDVPDNVTFTEVTIPAGVL